MRFGVDADAELACIDTHRFCEDGQVDSEGVSGAGASNGDAEGDGRGVELGLIGAAGVAVADLSELEMIAQVDARG